MPAAGLNPLRVGPEDVEASEAGELVRKLGVGNQAKGLIKAVARGVPRGLRVAASRFEHVERSRFLDEEEVLEQTKETVGEDIVVKVLSARVRGDKSRPLDSNVVILYEAPSGRTARCFVSYEEGFPKSQRAFDRALETGAIGASPEDDPKTLRSQNERLQSEVEGALKRAAEAEEEAATARREAEAAKGEEPAGDDNKVEAPTGKAKDLIAKIKAGDFSREQLDALIAESDARTVVKAAKAQRESLDSGD